MNACSNPIGLSVNVSKGDSYKYHIEVSQTNRFELLGQNSTTKQDAIMDLDITVDDIEPNGDITMSYKYETLNVEIDADGVKSIISTDDGDSDDPMAMLYNGMVGKGFKVKMSKNGEVKDIIGVNDLLDSMIDSIANSIDIEEDMQPFLSDMRENLKEILGDEVLRESISQSTSALPDVGDVKIGDSWTVKDELQTFMPMELETTYTLEKIEDGFAHISVKSEQRIQSADPINMFGIDMVPDLVSNTTGDVKINVKNGFLSEGEMEQKLTGKMTISMLGMEDLEDFDMGDMELPMETVTKTVYSITKN